MAIGAEANLGFSSTISNGYDVSTTSGSSTGSNNPNVGFPVQTVTTRSEVKNDSESLGMLHSFALNLTWYFGGKSK